MDNDLGEFNNLADNPEHTQVVKKMQELISDLYCHHAALHKKEKAASQEVISSCGFSSSHHAGILPSLGIQG